MIESLYQTAGKDYERITVAMIAREIVSNRSSGFIEGPLELLAEMASRYLVRGLGLSEGSVESTKNSIIQEVEKVSTD